MGPLGEEGNIKDELVGRSVDLHAIFAPHLHAFHVLSRVQPREIPPGPVSPPSFSKVLGPRSPGGREGGWAPLHRSPGWAGTAGVRTLCPEPEQRMEPTRPSPCGREATDQVGEGEWGKGAPLLGGWG